ncbi:hypothetical protein [Lysinibacillus sphaericus]|nr:hypothetical protein [Lysinibacillus sphaericus]
MRAFLFIIMSLLAIVVLGCTDKELAVEKWRRSAFLTAKDLTL